MPQTKQSQEPQNRTLNLTIGASELMQYSSNPAPMLQIYIYTEVHVKHNL